MAGEDDVRAGVLEGPPQLRDLGPAPARREARVMPGGEDALVPVPGEVPLEPALLLGSPLAADLPLHHPRLSRGATEAVQPDHVPGPKVERVPALAAPACPALAEVAPVAARAEVRLLRRPVLVVSDDRPGDAEVTPPAAVIAAAEVAEAPMAVLRIAERHDPVRAAQQPAGRLLPAARADPRATVEVRVTGVAGDVARGRQQRGRLRRRGREGRREREAQ